MTAIARGIAAALLLAPLAAPAADSSWYLTAAGGYTWAQSSSLSTGHDQNLAFPVSSGSSESHGAMRFGGGWFVLPRVALEAAWADYGKQSFDVTGVPSPAFVPEVLSERRTSERKVSAVTLDMVGHWPVDPRVTLVGRVGAGYGLVEFSSHVAAPGGFPFGSGPQDAAYGARTRSWAFHAAGGARVVDLAPTWDLEAYVEYLGPVGSEFSGSSLDRTGRSSQVTIWLGVVKRF